MQGSFEITREIDIDASPEMVFRFFTEPALLARWLCAQAEVDAHPGGGYLFNVTGSHITRGTFLVVEPGRRLVYTWLFDHVEPPLPTTVEVTLTPVGRGTRVRLHHHGFADRPARDRHTAGWAHYLPRLAAAAAGGEPGADEWRTELPSSTEA